MKHSEEKAYHTTDLGVPDYEYYLSEARRLRAEAIADGLHKLYLLLKPKSKGKAEKKPTAPLRPAF